MRSTTTIVIILLTAVSSPAILLPVSESDFNGSAVSVTLDNVGNGTEVNGLVVDGVTFQVTLAGVAINGLVIVDGGPGTTNHIVPPNVVSLAKPSSLVLDLTFPSFQTQFGYGFAILTSGDVSDATSIELFSGLTSLGSLTFPGTSDPIFTGGFAAIRSTTPFDRAQLSFSGVGAAFAVDNIRFGVPDSGSTLLSFAMAVAVLGICANRRWALRGTCGLVLKRSDRPSNFSR